MLIAAVRARAEFMVDRPLTWVMLVGFVGTFVASVGLWVTYGRRSARTSDAGRPA